MLLRKHIIGLSLVITAFVPLGAQAGIITTGSIFATDLLNNQIPTPLNIAGNRSINAIIVGDTLGVPGTLLVNSGSTLNSRNVVNLGQTANGTATVTGTGSVINTRTLNMSLGVSAANSILTIDLGGRFTAQRADIGSGNVAQVNVDNSSRFEVLGSLLVGKKGIVLTSTGSIVSIGGDPPTNFPPQSLLPGSAGILTVNGAITLSSASTLILENTIGDKIVVDGGTLKADHGNIVATGNSGLTPSDPKVISVKNSGHLVLDNGSTLDANQLVVAGVGIADAQFTRSSLGTLQSLAIGGDNGIGTVTVDLSSQLTVDQLAVAIGADSVGKLEVTASALKTNDTDIGASPGSIGTVNIVGSNWKSTGTIEVGRDGQGNLNITNTSTLDANTLNIKNGTVVVSPDSTLAGDINVGDPSGILPPSYLITSGKVDGFVTVYAGSALKGTGPIDAGTDFKPGSTIDPGFSPGVMTFNGGYHQEAGSILHLQIGGTDVVDYDALILNGAVLIDPGAIIDIEFINGFVPKDTDEFDLFGGLGFNPSELLGAVFEISHAPGFSFDPFSNHFTFNPDSGDGGGGGDGGGSPSDVPEPSTFLVFAAALASWLVGGRARNRAARL